VLHRDGSNDMSYKEMAARDAIVGIYPAMSASTSKAVHFSALSHRDGPFTAARETFHYLAVPKPQDLTCTVIERANGIRRQWIQYWKTATGDRSSMTVNPH
jgi:hypothetical protein